MTIQTLNSIFEKLKKSAVFGEKLSEKKKTILTKFWSDNWHKLKGKQNHNPLFDCQACYKSAKPWKPRKVSSPCLQTLATNIKSRQKLVVYSTLWNFQQRVPQKIQDNFYKTSQKKYLDIPNLKLHVP